MNKFRFDGCTPPIILEVLYKELWTHIFSFGTFKMISNLQFTSKWFYNLYWDLISDLDLHNENQNEMVLIVSKVNHKTINTIFLGYNVYINDLYIFRLINYNFNLSRLYLNSTKIVNSSLELISIGFPRLITLNISDCKDITDDGIAFLSNLKLLENFNCKDINKLTDKSIESISSLTNLKDLRMSVSPHVLLSLDKGSGVKVNKMKLNQLQETIGDCGFNFLSPLVKLTYLDVGKFMSPTSKSIDTLYLLTNLQTLIIEQAQLLNNEAIYKISMLSSIEYLTLNKAQYVTNLHELSKNKNLKQLTLCDSIINDDVLESYESLPNLTYLNVSRCHLITFVGIVKFQKKIKHTHPFKTLVVTRCPDLQLINEIIREESEWKIVY